MESSVTVTIAIQSESTLDILTLRHSLMPYAQTYDTSTKNIGWDTVIAVIKDVGESAASAKAIYEIAKLIYEHTRKKQAKLSAPGKSDLDLTTATDQEVLEWLLK